MGFVYAMKSYGVILILTFLLFTNVELFFFFENSKSGFQSKSGLQSKSGPQSKSGTDMTRGGVEPKTSGSAEGGIEPAHWDAEKLKRGVEGVSVSGCL